ncbi:hypothetical protein [Hyunsoonleella flava]|uniref:hypothetical protein n=1 Tax=Hyunsoonleella flava TaxID=2527939 RepID=UPI0013EF18B4|nr:hypothetical protein [Hyunsoonleella flava]
MEYSFCDRAEEMPQNVYEMTWILGSKIRTNQHYTEEMFYSIPFLFNTRLNLKN